MKTKQQLLVLSVRLTALKMKKLRFALRAPGKAVHVLLVTLLPGPFYAKRAAASLTATLVTGSCSVDSK